METNSEAQELREGQRTRKKLNECFGKVFDEAKSTDIVFCFDENKTEIKGHKLVLSTRSPVFDAMFNGGFEDKGRVEIQDAKADDFQSFIRFLYTDEIELSAENVVGVLHLADKYNVQLLFEVCVQYLAENLIVDNACAIFAAAKKYNSEDLKVLALDIICLNAKDCLITEAFLQLNSDDVEDIAGCESLSCREEILFECLDEWASERCREKEVDSTDANKRMVLGKLLFTVRFPLMEYEYIVSKLSKRQICNDSEMVKILQLRAANEDDEVSINDVPHFQIVARKSIQFESVVIIPNGKYILDSGVCSGKTREISFKVSENSWFYGIMIYGPTGKQRFGVEIVLRDESMNELARGQIFITSEEKKYTCNIVLNSPTYLRGMKRYICTFAIFSSSAVEFYSLPDNRLTYDKEEEAILIDPDQEDEDEDEGDILVSHHDTFVEEKPKPASDEEEDHPLKKHFRGKCVTLLERDDMLAGFLLF